MDSVLKELNQREVVLSLLIDQEITWVVGHLFHQNGEFYLVNMKERRKGPYQIVRGVHNVCSLCLSSYPKKVLIGEGKDAFLAFKIEGGEVEQIGEWKSWQPAYFGYFVERGDYSVVPFQRKIVLKLGGANNNLGNGTYRGEITGPGKKPGILRFQNPERLMTETSNRSYEELKLGAGRDAIGIDSRSIISAWRSDRGALEDDLWSEDISVA